MCVIATALVRIPAVHPLRTPVGGSLRSSPQEIPQLGIITAV